MLCYYKFSLFFNIILLKWRKGGEKGFVKKKKTSLLEIMDRKPVSGLLRDTSYNIHQEPKTVTCFNEDRWKVENLEEEI